MNYSDWIGLIGLLMGITTFLGGLVAWYRGAVEKRYASQRDFGHLKRNQEQMAQSIQLLQDELEALSHDATRIQQSIQDVDRNFDDHARTFIEMKALVLSISNRLEWISAKMDGTTSSGWRIPPSSPPL